MSPYKNQDKMRILFLSPLPPPFGGISIWTEKILKYGLPCPFEFKIVNTKILGNRKVHQKATINIYELKRTTAILINCIKQLYVFRPHITHLNCSLSPLGICRNIICALICKLNNTKIICHFRGNIPDFPRNYLFGFSFYLLKKLIKISDTNIVLNKPSLFFIEKLNVSDRKKTNYLIPGLIDDSFFSLESSSNHTSKTLYRKRGEFRAIYVGGLTNEKGANDVIDIAKEFLNIEFILIGTSIEGIKSKSDNVLILPPTNNENVLLELRKSDFFIFLSHSEGFPNAILEAMAIGLPVIATNVGAIPEMIDDGLGGFLVPPQNLEMIKTAITKLINIPNFMSLGKYNFQKAKENYSYSIVIDKLCNVYYNTINRE